MPDSALHSSFGVEKAVQTHQSMRLLVNANLMYLLPIIVTAPHTTDSNMTTQLQQLSNRKYIIGNILFIIWHVNGVNMFADKCN